MSEKKRRLVYCSAGTDEIRIVCNSIDEAINCFRADAEVILHDASEDGGTIELSVREMSDEEMASIQEA